MAGGRSRKGRQPVKGVARQTEKRDRPKIGDKVWTVEWCVQIVLEEDGSVDRDSCKMACRNFPYNQKDAALAFAKEKLKEDRLGETHIWAREFRPYDEDDPNPIPGAGYWEDISDAIYVGDEC